MAQHHTSRSGRCKAKILPGACIILRFLVHYSGMKKDTHPTYYSDTKVVCACGNTFSVGSTQKDIHTEICSNCHPFYTGKQNLVDTAGRVERFQAMVKKTSDIKGRGTKKRGAEKKGAGPLDNQEKLEKIKATLDAK